MSGREVAGQRLVAAGSYIFRGRPWAKPRPLPGFFHFPNLDAESFYQKPIYLAKSYLIINQPPAAGYLDQLVEVIRVPKTSRQWITGGFSLFSVGF